MSKLTEDQIRVNRAELLEMWVKKVKPEWVNLSHYLNNEDMEEVKRRWSEDHITYDEYNKEYHKALENIAEKCDGPEGPSNECGAVGCLAGWGWTNYNYREWCRNNKKIITSEGSLTEWLGLHDSHEYFLEAGECDVIYRDEDGGTGLTDYEEALERLYCIQDEPVVLE